MSISAGDGSLNVSVVDGSSYTGLRAPDGSLYVVNNNGSSFVGASNHCGGWNVTYVTSDVSSIRAQDGSLNVTTSPFVKGAMKVSVVSGSFTGGGGSTPTYYILGF